MAAPAGGTGNPNEHNDRLVGNINRIGKTAFALRAVHRSGRMAARDASGGVMLLRIPQHDPGSLQGKGDSYIQFC